MFSNDHLGMQYMLHGYCIYFLTLFTVLYTHSTTHVFPTHTRMNSALLSRFDLVFILLDKPDEEMDSRLSEHVMSLHSGHPKGGAPTTSLRATARRTKEVSD